MRTAKLHHTETQLQLADVSMAV